jgi:hypothetical protein
VVRHSGGPGLPLRVCKRVVVGCLVSWLGGCVLGGPVLWHSRQDDSKLPMSQGCGSGLLQMIGRLACNSNSSSRGLGWSSAWGRLGNRGRAAADPAAGCGRPLLRWRTHGASGALCWWRLLLTKVGVWTGSLARQVLTRQPFAAAKCSKHSRLHNT